MSTFVSAFQPRNFKHPQVFDLPKVGDVHVPALPANDDNLEKKKQKTCNYAKI